MRRTHPAWERASPKSQQLTSDLVLNSKFFSPETGHEAGMSTITTLTQHGSEPSSHREKAEQETQAKRDGKEKNKTVPISGDMIVYIENPKRSMNKLLTLINGFGRVAGQDVRATHKNQLYFYTRMIMFHKNHLNNFWLDNIFTWVKTKRYKNVYVPIYLGPDPPKQGLGSWEFFFF